MPEPLSSSRRFWNEAAQTMDRAALRALQDERLREAVHRAYEHAPFFRRRFDAAGIKPDDVKTVDDLAHVPPFAKAALRQNEEAYPPIGDYRATGLQGPVRLAMSTGTTGRPTFSLFTPNDWAIECELGARNNWRMGMRPGQIVVNAHPGYLNCGQENVARVVEHTGCLSVSIGPPGDDDALADVLTKLEGLPIDHWLLMPAAVLRIRDVAERIGWKGTLPPLEAATPNRQLDLISAGTECVAFLGATCQPGQGKGAHLHEDYAVVEAVDPVSHEPVPDGTRGYLLCTSLGRDNPMIRYNLEDVVRIDSSPCDCGETHRRAFWDGRGKDVVEVGTKRVLPIDVWRHLPVDTDYVLLRKPGDMTRLEVRVEGDVPADFVDQVEADLAVPVALERLPVGSLDKAIYKFNRVVDVPA